jgi:amidohydrolase
MPAFHLLADPWHGNQVRSTLEGARHGPLQQSTGGPAAMSQTVDGCHAIAVFSRLSCIGRKRRQVGMADLDNINFEGIAAFRRQLHMFPDASREEERTAAVVAAWLAPTEPDEIVTGLGGHGVAAVFKGPEPGPTVLLRAELDGLRIADLADVPHRSQVAMRGHLCGHDGHSATLVVCAQALSHRRPARGRVVLMFQPAEEDGSGAAAVIADPHYARLAPDWAFSFHNLPGVPFGEAALRTGPVNCASRGMTIRLEGRTAHASMPETGISPMAALAELMPALTALSGGHPTAPDFTLATVTHCAMGEPVFGIAPATAQLFVTLRTLTDDRMGAMVAKAEALVTDCAQRNGLAVTWTFDDIFAHVENDAEAVARFVSALATIGVPHAPFDLPMRASEDFGRFGHAFNGRKPQSAMVFLGAGVSHPQLHNPDYDYPDALTPIAASLFMTLVRDICG